MTKIAAMLVKDPHLHLLNVNRNITREETPQKRNRKTAETQTRGTDAVIRGKGRITLTGTTMTADAVNHGSVITRETVTGDGMKTDNNRHFHRLRCYLLRHQSLDNRYFHRLRGHFLMHHSLGIRQYHRPQCHHLLQYPLNDA